ncbi:hypothetical protein QR680_017676 [Steinernema hermaphroditum]|uniref:Metalloendopeptidase n=1 Tax=Steinernema hermaphroditum TaxID=289476 RepID=A0AA39HFF2_9BILA|nr:hypothetical protein QR680_017676 [Steinernema hermaphroditum]
MRVLAPLVLLLAFVRGQPSPWGWAPPPPWAFGPNPGMIRQMLDAFNEDPNSVPPWVFRRIQRFCFNHPFAPRCQKLLSGPSPDMMMMETPPPPAPMPHRTQPPPLPPPVFTAPPPPPPPPPTTTPPPTFSWAPSEPLPPSIPAFPQSGVPHGPPAPPLDRRRRSIDSLQTTIPSFLLSRLNPLKLGELAPSNRQLMLSSCNGKVKCAETRPEYASRRADVAKSEVAVLGKLDPSANANSVIEKRLDQIQQVKLELLKTAGLGAVLPANDGLFQQDVLLTERQSAALLQQLRVTGRRRRYAIFLEGFPTQTWEKGKPIIYSFDPTLLEGEKTQIKEALTQIEANTCIRFQYAPNRPENTFLYYVKTFSSAVCGLSYVGRISPANPIYLSFNCPNPVGIAIHETLHALGVAHQHLRGDRDDFVQIDWSNINPQLYDHFVQADSKQFTSYGVPYDYYSIMHYSAFVASINPLKPSIIPKKQSERFMTVIGQRKNLSDRDVELLNAMYCSKGCEDKNVYCGAWAVKSLCQTPDQLGWMKANCQKSCGFCR